MNLKNSTLNLVLFYSILLINFNSYSLHRSENEITQEINQRELELKNLIYDLEKFKKTQPDLNLDALKNDIVDLEHLLTTLRHERETTPTLESQARREFELRSIDQLNQEIKKLDTELKNLRHKLEFWRSTSKKTEKIQRTGTGGAPFVRTSIGGTPFSDEINEIQQKITEIEKKISQIKDAIRDKESLRTAIIKQKESPLKKLLALGERFVKESASMTTSSKRLEELPKMSEEIAREIRHLIAAKDITKIDLNTRLSNGSTLLMIAAELAENVAAQIIPLLLANGANINAISTQQNTTALTFAVYHKHPETVRLLLANGADANLGMPLINLAINRANKDDKRDVLIVKRLINAGARVTEQDINKANEKGLKDIVAAFKNYPLG